jgi:hypothetical protein
MVFNTAATCRFSPHTPQVHPAAWHQALLARCHDALARIRAWRVVLTMGDGGQRSPAVGHPCPLTPSALAAGGWAVGAVLHSNQQQSCWVRFNLPAELKSDAVIAALLEELELVSCGVRVAAW